uniref:Cytochrome P450 20A1 n=1 Tax=Phallusia mammillata TaxID=59560 RepID=A0A6F9DA68_9ASCI|nr:cytochrome P450 20A1 [Phallusia mammillata]
MLDVHISVTGVAILAIILLLVLIGLLFYLYPGSTRLTTIPGPDASDAKEGNLSDLERSGSLHEYLRELHCEFGDVVAFRLGPKLVVSTCDLKHFAPRSQVFEIPGFLFDDWKLLVGDQSFLFATGLNVFKRRDFLEYKVKSVAREEHAKTFRSLSKELVQKWVKLPEGEHIPLTQHMRGLAMKGVCSMMFGDHFSSNEQIIKLHKTWELCWTEVLAISKKEPTKESKEIKKAVKELREIFQDAIDSQWKKQKRSSSLSIIDGLLAASNDILSEEQMLADVITSFSIGIQITTAVLSWMMYFIATNEKTQKKLQQNLSDVKSLDLMPDTIFDNRFMKAVLKESVRCSEMFSMVARQQDMDTTIDEHVVEKNTPVIEAVSVAMKLEKLWTSPCLFDPSRYLQKDTDLPDPLTFIPFAFAGSRRQPQESLVYHLAAITAASVFSDLSVSLAGSESDFLEPSYESFVAMPTKDEIWIAVSKRSQNVESLGTG